MNAETRAKELLDAIVERGTGGWRFAAEVEESLPLIAAALRQAENDKLEEAARAIRLAYVSTATPPISNAVVSEDYLEGLNDALADVLALKSKD